MRSARAFVATLAATAILSSSASGQATDAKPQGVPMTAMTSPTTIPAGPNDDWPSNALAYLEALKGQGTLPPDPDRFLLRFGGGRRDASITPAQFHQALANCRQTYQHVSASQGLVAEWDCAGRGALGRHLVLQIGAYGGRLADAVVWVDRRPPATI